MSGPVDLKALVATSPFCRFLNVETQVDERGVLVILPARNTLIGNVLLPAMHGGAVASFLEIACMLQLVHETGNAAPARAIDINVEYLRPTRPEIVHARAKIRRLGRRVATVHGEAWQKDEVTPTCLVQSHFRLPKPAG
jgi:uncharacterized protein (TIGR00369 family)